VVQLRIGLSELAVFGALFQMLERLHRALSRILAQLDTERLSVGVRERSVRQRKDKRWPPVSDEAASAPWPRRALG
jgi:hypothetical protein